jgi:unsaturated chondroitin disaccharide hydrolase
LRGRFIRAWNDDKTGWAIIDCLMNLPLLYWAARELDDPRYTFIAEAHADTVLRHFLRPDGSSRHIVSFDPQTGDFLEALGGQGHAPESAWSRGNAWALYGLAIMFRNSGESRFLEGARRVARFFVDHLPADRVPYWDFRVPVAADTPRDSSAGAIAASGLLELARHVPSGEAGTWRDTAIRITRSLDASFGAWEADEEGLLLEGTGHFPAGQNVRVPLIYGDYYFVETLAKLRGQDSLFW